MTPLLPLLLVRRAAYPHVAMLGRVPPVVIAVDVAHGEREERYLLLWRGNEEQAQ